MPNFNSKLGDWEAAQEFAVNPNAKPGENPVYQGPDRAAQQMLAENGGKLGVPYNLFPELVIQSRQLGFKTVDEYLEVHGWSKEEALKRFEANKKQIVTHADKERKPAVKVQGGGRDYAMQGQDREGGIGKLPSDVPAQFVK